MSAVDGLGGLDEEFRPGTIDPMFDRRFATSVALTVLAFLGPACAPQHQPIEVSAAGQPHPPAWMAQGDGFYEGVFQGVAMAPSDEVDGVEQAKARARHALTSVLGEFARAWGPREEARPPEVARLVAALLAAAETEVWVAPDGRVHARAASPLASHAALLDALDWPTVQARQSVRRGTTSSLDLEPPAVPWLEAPPVEWEGRPVLAAIGWAMKIRNESLRVSDARNKALGNLAAHLELWAAQLVVEDPRFAGALGLAAIRRIRIVGEHDGPKGAAALAIVGDAELEAAIDEVIRPAAWRPNLKRASRAWLASALHIGPPPQPGTYYRAAFAEAVEQGTFDPDAYVTHREPSVSFEPPAVRVDTGQEMVLSWVRWTRSGTVAVAERRGEDTDWAPCVLRARDARRLDTDLLGGGVETLVLLPLGFEALAERERAKRTELRRRSVQGLYVATDGRQVRLEAETPFEIHRCLPSCQRERATWCVSLGASTWLLDEQDRQLTEVRRAGRLCPGGRAFEPKVGARTFQRSVPPPD
ncbi:MAG: hypothetical protein L6Q95_02880 [Planctomycetes bacterium]|nr:hypothetical protein [Planctomycetota bacterium]